MSDDGEERSGQDFDGGLTKDPVAMIVSGAMNEPTIDADFRQELRDRLVTEANQQAAALPAVVVRRPVLRRLTTRLVIPAAAALVAAILLIVTAPALRQHTRSVQVSASSALEGLISVNPASPVLVHFSQPMDHRSVEAALQVEPAVAVRTSWQGDDLLVTAANGLAPNTGYLIGFDPNRARTATGDRPKAHPYVSFGTAPIAPAQRQAAPAVLPLDTLASADDGSEAVITADGSVLATALRTGAGPSALARLVGSRVQPIAPATQAICVSQSGRSLAYLLGSGTDTSIVMADGDGLNGHPVRAQVDAGSPLGWIGDNNVSFISGGALKAIDRVGTVRTLMAGPIHPETDSVVIAPGGRWIFIGSAGGRGGGQVVDLQTHSTQTLPAAAGSPGFSADGATIYWVDGSGTRPQLAVAPSGGARSFTSPCLWRAGTRSPIWASMPTAACSSTRFTIPTPAPSSAWQTCRPVRPWLRSAGQDSPRTGRPRGTTSPSSSPATTVPRSTWSESRPRSAPPNRRWSRPPAPLPGPRLAGMPTLCGRSRHPGSSLPGFRSPHGRVC